METALFYKIANILWLSLGLVSGILGIYFIRKEPRQIRNGIFLFMCLVGTTIGGLGLYAPNKYYSDGTMVLGDGSDITFLIFLAFILIAFLGGIGLCINGVKVIKKEGYSLTHVLPVFFGIAGILWPVLMLFILIGSINGTLYFLIGRIALFMFLYIPMMLAIFLLYSLVYRVLPKNKNSDFILVLGAGLKDGLVVTPLLKGRLNKAIKLYNGSKKKPYIIVSGGQGADEYVSEAFAMEDYLLNQNIPKEKIIKEEHSKNTYENMLFSKKIMIERKPDYKCLFVTSNYHVLRAALLAKSVNLKGQGFGGKTAFYYLPAAFIREYVAIIFRYKKMAVLYVIGAILFVIGSFLIKEYFLH